MSGEISVYVRPMDEAFNASAAILQTARIYAAYHALSFPQDPVFSKDAWGKPFFAAAPHLHISLSHSGRYWLAALAASPLGIDIQKHQPCRMSALSRRFFHEQESRYLENTGYQEFFAVWTAKESYVKYTGRGIDESFGAFSVIKNNGIAGEINGVQLRFLPFYPGYTVCLCTPNTGTVTMALFDAESGFYKTVKPSEMTV